MITRIHIENFKSLVDFDLPTGELRLEKFTCLVGMNGAGKSTVLQALDFLGQLMTGKLNEWLAHREWDSIDLVSRLPREPVWVKRGDRQVLQSWRLLVTIPFEIEFALPSGKSAVWRGKFNRVQLRCTWEEIRVEDQAEPVLVHNDGVLRTLTDGAPATDRDTKELIYEGSILSAYNLEEEACRYIKSVMRGLKSLEMLTPKAMRRRSRQGADIGYGGEQLSAFVGGLPFPDILELIEAVQKFYPQITTLDTSTIRGGWKHLWGREAFATSLRVTASNMNDGMLRVIAILAQAGSVQSFVACEEV